MTPTAAGPTRRAPESTEAWSAHVAERVVAEVAALAGGGLRPEVARLLAELATEGCGAFLALHDGEPDACASQRMELLVGDLFLDVEISLEDAMALHRHLEQVLWREVQETPPAALRDADPVGLEAASRRFFNDLAGAVADSYLAARRGHDSDRSAAETDLLACLLSSPPQLGRARRAARALGIDLDVPWEVSVIAPRAGGSVSGGVTARLRRALWGAVVVAARLEPGLVVAVSRRGSAAAWPDLGAELAAGSGGTHRDVRGLRESYDEALEVLELARRQGLRRLRFDDAWFDRFLAGTVSADELAELVLTPLDALTPNRRSSVLETLEAFLDCGGSVSAVAEALHLHRQTVHYRLQNVRRLFAPLLATANGRLALHIAVKATRLRGRR